MAVDLMGAWGGSAGGNFWDDEPQPDLDLEAGTGGGGTTNHTNDHGQEGQLPDPFETFEEKDDPGAYMEAYDRIKSDIRKIENNARAIKKLSERYNSSTEKEENDAIMQKLDDIMSSNSTVTRKIKNGLKTEKGENDKYLKANKGSSVGQWRVNQLNSCTRRFKTSSLQFSHQLNTFNDTLRLL
eukprot:UN10381